MRERFDVAIAGGGWAGLTLALQLKKRRPELDVVVLDQRGPAPEAAHKVGESAVEVSSFYLREVLGLRDHLESAQLTKFGLRLFMSQGQNRDLARRLEFGPLGGPTPATLQRYRNLPLPTYNLDRGRLENHLVACAEAAEVRRRRVRVESLQVSASGHQLSTNRGVIRARWLVDASGRSGLLKRHLQLSRRVGHTVHAAWFRIPGRIDVESWSSRPSFRQRTYPGLRHLSTCHLMGRGYWVWLIPLASGATSVGIVADPRFHAPGTFSRYPRARAWLDRHEPQLADALRGVEPLDFQVRRGGAYGCQRLFSAERWAIVGDAGAFLDPLYSPGGDFIAFGNTLVTELIEQDLAGAPLAGAVAFAERLFDSLYQTYLHTYRDQYEVMGHPLAMVTKAVWDTLVYFGYTVPLFTHQRLWDRSFLTSLSVTTAELRRLQTELQPFFRAWARSGPDQSGDRAVDQGQLRFLQERYITGRPTRGDGELRRVVASNVAVMSRTADAIRARVNESRSDPGGGEVAAGIAHIWGEA